MALPHATVASLAALRALAVVDVDGAREIIIVAVDAVRLAPDYLDVLEEKKAEGWMCGQQARIREVARFAALLGELDGKVIPALNLDASNEVMRRRLGTIGDALRRISSRYSLLPPPDLVRLARPLSTFLIVASREAKQSVSRFGELLVDINGHVQSSLDSRVDLEALPTVRVASLLDLQAFSGVVDAHEIHVRAVHAVCHARDYHNFVLEKKSTGWRCAQETKVRKIARFATLLLELSDDIIPNLKDDPSNIRLIRRLRSRGTMMTRIVKVKRRAPAALVAMAGPLANRVVGAAVSVLNGKCKPGWLVGRLDVIGLQIQTCLNAYVPLVEDDESEEGDEP